MNLSVCCHILLNKIVITMIRTLFERRLENLIIIPFNILHYAGQCTFQIAKTHQQHYILEEIKAKSNPRIFAGILHRVSIIN